MKMRLLTGLIAAVCFSQAASAAELTGGTISNQTTATADVEFNQPITLQNTLTPISGLKAGQEIDMDNPLTIANGSLAIKDSGVTALLALKSGDTLKNGDTSGALTAYAAGHEGEKGYGFAYMPIPKGVDMKTMADEYDSTNINGEMYLVSRTASSNLDYSVLAFDSGNTAIKPGSYTISVTGAIYNP